MSIPYYASPILLKAGLSDFSYEAGVIRNNYGIDDYNYGRPLAVGTYSLGITDRYTAGAHLELLKQQQTIGFNNNYLLGYWGTISLGAAGSRSNLGAGGLLSLGLSHNARFLSYGVRSTLATSHYTQVGTLYSQNFPSTTLQSYLGIGSNGLGSVMLSFTALSNAYNEEKSIWYNYLFPNSEILSINYNVTLFKQLFLSAGAFKDFKNSLNNQVFISLTMPLDADKFISANNLQQQGNNQSFLQLMKNLPFGEGYGYQAFLSNSKNIPTQANFLLQKNYGLFSARYANYDQTDNFELNARGSLVHFAGYNFPARYVEQSFALVEVPGFKNVDVYSRNLLVGKTNSRGFLYIPETLAYQLNELEIDARSLPFNTNITSTKKTVVPYWKSGILARFNVTEVKPILLSLRLSTGELVPAGASLYLDSDTSHTIPIGYGGEAYIEAKDEKTLSGHISWLNSRCYFRYDLPKSHENLIKDSAICYTKPA